MKKQEHPSILLTGADGFLGSRIYKRLSDYPGQLHILELSRGSLGRIGGELDSCVPFFLDETSIDEIFGEHSIDIVIHAATIYGRGGEDVTGIIEGNLLFAIDLLESGKKNGLSLFVNCDTFFPKYYSGLPAYSLTKKQLVEWLRLEKSVAIVNMVLHHMYGPDDNPTKFIPFVIGSLLGSGEELALTPCEQTRDFIYVDDAARAFTALIDHAGSLDPGFTQFEIGTGASVPVKELVNKVVEITGSSVKPVFGALDLRSDEIMEAKANVTGFRQLTGWSHEVSLHDGLSDTIDWYKKHVRK
jgi:CDP-paratose synthetase